MPGPRTAMRSARRCSRRTAANATRPRSSGSIRSMRCTETSGVAIAGAPSVVVEAVELDWPGTRNTRDLGGLPTAAGGRTRPGALVRSASLQSLTTEGWDTLVAHGVRTVVD